MWPTPESIFLILIASICGHCLTLNVTQVTYRNGGLWHYPTGIDYHSPTNSIITSAYTDNLGQPCNLMRLDALGNQIPYSNLTMVPGEVMFHIVRPSPGPWTPGDVFVGSVFFTSISNLSKALSPNGYIIRVADLGQTVIKPWCQFPPGVYRIIALTIDETGVFNYSMIVGADLTGLIYRVEYGNDTNCGNWTLLTQTLACESLLIVPPDAGRYGRLAGKLLIGSHSGSSSALLTVYDPVTGNTSKFAYTQQTIEDIDIIVPKANLFSVNGETNRILSADWRQFDGYEGQLLVTSELPGTLSLLSWPANASAPVFTPIAVVPPAGTYIGTFEQSAFAPAGVVGLLPSWFDLCLELSTTTGPSVPITPFTLSGSAQAVSQYLYNQPPNLKSYNGDALLPAEADTALMWLSRDFQNTWSLTMLFDAANSGTGGSIDVTLVSSAFDGSRNAPSAQQQDDPSGQPDTDRPDTYVLAGGVGKLSFSWSNATTDGVVISPLDFIGAAPLGKGLQGPCYLSLAPVVRACVIFARVPLRDVWDVGSLDAR
eukprot:TRINITY_DN5330_c1_g1_i5.p1 TRINITY_DN5330_c1_g1~~TRINITY_DN5330_c1_g1_i5.p1  ORF type:complete len:542 (+),score=185.90 TRINITY_DN5330_c1_g1_i5:78-1703(+)